MVVNAGGSKLRLTTMDVEERSRGGGPGKPKTTTKWKDKVQGNPKTKQGPALPKKHQFLYGTISEKKA